MAQLFLELYEKKKLVMNNSVSSFKNARLLLNVSS
jgi:hypothetical protein